MNVNIDINSEDILAQFQMSKDEVESVIDYAVKEITASFARKWEEEAMLSLHSTRSRYIESLTVIDEGRMSGAVILSYQDPLVKMIEEGADPRDMKEDFSKSDKVKYNKAGGWYLTVPFKMGAPNTQGDALGGVTNLPQEVHEVVSKKPIDSISGRSQGLTITEVPDKYKAPATRAKIEVPKSKSFEAYLHKSSIYQGTFKQVDKTTGQTSYGSFRRVGENSDPMSWIFPGLPAANLADKALDKLDSVMEMELSRAINNALANFGFED